MDADRTMRQEPDRPAEHTVFVIDDVAFDAAPQELLQEWEALARAPIHPNPFYTHAALNALLAADPAARAGLRLLCLRMRSGARPGKLIGLLPYILRGKRIGWRRAVANYTSPYLPCGTPLIARDAPSGWAQALMGALIALRRPIILKHLPVSGPIGETLLAALADHAAQWRIIDPFERPIATQAPSYDAFARRAYGRSRRKGLKRLHNALSASGALSLTGSTDTIDCAAAVAPFLTLEAGGWKGARGSALADRRETIAMLERLFRADHPPGSRRVDELRLDGRPIAISMSLVQAGTAFLWKTAYDERLRRYAPGIVLEDAIVQALHTDPGLEGLDSCTLAPSPLQDLYDERLSIADLMIVPGPGAAFLFGVEQNLRNLRRHAIGWLRRKRR